MPMHLEAITRDSQSPAVLDRLIQHELNSPEQTLVSSDKQYIHMTHYMRDASTNEVIGKFVFTLHINSEKKTMNILDVDLSLLNETPVKLSLLEKLPKSSAANEYYNVMTFYTSRHLQIETVNRHAINGDITGTAQDVFASAFPFKLSVFDDLDTMNSAFGFRKAKMFGKKKPSTNGLAADFIAPGNVVSAQTVTDET